MEALEVFVYQGTVRLLTKMKNYGQGLLDVCVQSKCAYMEKISLRLPN